MPPAKPRATVRKPYCAIDFGTSNSALALPAPTVEGGFVLAPLEDGQTGMPTAVFFTADGADRFFGRAAIAAYVDGLDGRLMRSIKSILGSELIEGSTEIGTGLSVRYLDVVVAYIRHLRAVGERQSGAPLSRLIVGRPVFFVDDDPAADARAEQTLAAACRFAGFDDVRFEFEPIAAALEYESRIDRERVVLVVDIGGGTSDFSIVRASPRAARVLDRRGDILANHGVHVAGTDFDRSVNLAAIMPALGHGTLDKVGRVVPSSIYYELATWHLINLAYLPASLAESHRMGTVYADLTSHRRLLRVLSHRLGHQLAALAEEAKIEVAGTGQARIDLAVVEASLEVAFDAPRQEQALAANVQRIVDAAAETVRRAGLAPGDIQALFFTGGSTGLSVLTDRIGALFPAAERVHGDRFASVASGLGLRARAVFGQA
jgi:hypothetical chaperone protein